MLGTVPILTMMFAHLAFHDERMSRTSMLGALVGFGGVVAVIGRSALGYVEAHIVAELAVLGGAVTIAGANILARAGATRASLVAHLVPLVTVVLGAVFLNERLPWEALLGMVLIVSGAWLVNQKTKPSTGKFLEP